MTARRSFFATVALGVVAALVVASALWWLVLAPTSQRFTAQFSSAVGLFPGSDVRVLGVRVGEVESVTPHGTTVEVVLAVDRDVAIPADAGAVSVSPSLVSDRYVQLTPAYTGGDRMADGTLIPVERTANPLELDQLYASLDRLTTALGPDGANSGGALSDLVEVQADVLDGTGQTINDSIGELSEAARTLSNSRGDLFATVDGLQKFTTALANNDAQVRAVNDRLADVAGFLAGERGDLAEALAALTIALDDVATFVRDNRGALQANVDKLTGITQLLVDQKSDLQEFLDVAPLAVSNLANAYNGYGGGLETRTNLNEISDPSLILCRALNESGAVAPGVLPAIPPELVAACDTLREQLGDALGIPDPVDIIAALQQGRLPPIPVLGFSAPAAGGPAGVPGASVPGTPGTPGGGG